MLTVKGYLSGQVSTSINQSALTNLKLYPGLKKFYFKVKSESKGHFKVTLHGSYRGHDLCVSEVGLDVWPVYKAAETKFFKQVKKAIKMKLSKIKKTRKTIEPYHGGYNDEYEFQH